MRVFNICIEEVVSETFEIEAENAEEAMRIASEMYNNCELILEPGELQQKYMAIVKPENEATSFVEF